MDVQTFLKETIEKVTSHPLIHVETGATIVEHSGFKGNFKTGISIKTQGEALSSHREREGEAGPRQWVVADAGGGGDASPSN